MSEMNFVSPPEAHYTVYKLTDPEGKVYIGFTGKTVNKRWKRGKNYYKQTTIRKAIDRLGWDAFRKEILCEKLTREGGEKLEKWFIAYYDSADPEKGYNRSLGGLGKGVRMSEVTKQNLRDAKIKLYEENPELIERIRQSVISAYANDPDYRRRVGTAVLAAFERDPTIKERISESVRQLWQDPDYRQRVTEGRAAIHVGNTEWSAVMQERGRQRFRERPELRTQISVFMSAYLQTPEGRKFVESDSHPKPVRCVETGEVYPSQKAAENATGFTGIHKACSGRNRTSGGYHWEYVQKL